MIFTKILTPVRIHRLTVRYKVDLLFPLQKRLAIHAVRQFCLRRSQSKQAQQPRTRQPRQQRPYKHGIRFKTACMTQGRLAVCNNRV